MKIFVLGNINSGKSYFIKKLTSLFNEYKIFQIDEYRKKYGDGSILKEELAQEKFVDDIFSEKNAIIEFSGLGKLSTKILSKLNNNSCIIFLIKENCSICINRIAKKDFNKIPYPKFENMETLPQTITRLDEEISSGEIHSLWYKQALKLYEATSYCDINSYPLKQYHKLFALLDKIKCDTTKAVVLFGSFARGTPTVDSDVDLFIITNESVNEVVNKLELNCMYLVIDSKIIIYDNEVIFEIFVMDNIQKFAKYYQMSIIKDINKTVLFDSINILAQLEKIANTTFDIEAEKNKICNKIKYFNFSLSGIIKRNDEYKYFFHVNILIHDFLRLRAIESGCTEYLYLPKLAKKYIKNEDWKILNYNIGDDMNTHYKKIQKILKQYI